MEDKSFQALLVDCDTARNMLGGMSRSFFYQLIAEGRIPRPIKYGKRSLWSVDSLRLHVQQEQNRAG